MGTKRAHTVSVRLARKRMPGAGTRKVMEQHARVHEGAGRHHDAARIWYKLATDAPSVALYWRKLGRNLYLDKRFAEARAPLERACALSPDAHAAHKMLAAVLFREGDDGRAREVLTDFYARHPLDRDPGDDGTRPGLLRVSGVTGVRAEVGWDLPEPPHVVRRGGHFSLKHLLPDPPGPLHRLTVSAPRAPSVADLPPVGLILNTIADPDVEGAALDGLAQFLKGRTEPVINAPAAVQATTRERNGARFADLPDIRFPRTVRVALTDRVPEAVRADIQAGGVTPPYIIRLTGTHKGRSVALIKSDGDLDAFLKDQDRAAENRGEAYAIEFIEARPARGYFHKMRLLSIDGELYPAVCHIDAHWNVHGFNRLTLMKNNPWMMDQERAFMDDPEAALGINVMDRLRTMAAQIDLEYFGFDFAVLDDGRPLIYELNPAMRHKFDYAQDFPYMRAPLQRITDAFTAMVKRRLDDAPPP